MLELFDVSYDELRQTREDELYKLRKKTFSDRLKWEVVCREDMEFDEFDNGTTRYLLGIYQEQLICSVRFTPLEQPNMITHTFHGCFGSVPLPAGGIESSRFFVDKNRARRLLGEHYPMSQILFLAMTNWAIHRGYKEIYTIVSRAMLRILKNSGWQIQELKEAFLNEKERIYLVLLPTQSQDQRQLSAKIDLQKSGETPFFTTWPLKLPV